MGGGIYDFFSHMASKAQPASPQAAPPKPNTYIGPLEKAVSEGVDPSNGKTFIYSMAPNTPLAQRLAIAQQEGVRANAVDQKVLGYARDWIKKNSQQGAMDVEVPFMLSPETHTALTKHIDLYNYVVKNANAAGDALQSGKLTQNEYDKFWDSTSPLREYLNKERGQIKQRIIDEGKQLLKGQSKS